MVDNGNIKITQQALKDKSVRIFRVLKLYTVQNLEEEINAEEQY